MIIITLASKLPNLFLSVSLFCGMCQQSSMDFSQATSHELLTKFIKQFIYLSIYLQVTASQGERSCKHSW